ncbi:MAG TPA: winged helix-turn-helix domain-containing protein [Lysobacter sp.]|nr:winged helix-turn-helix domain-containing protein [Lysobacter sp.]
MARPAETVSPPRSDRLHVGECLVEVPLRHVHAPNARRPVRITPKAMGVLLALARQPGRVVSRDALLAEVWPGTLPTDDVLTQAVTQLRKAFGESRGQARYIETIAKSGYRLLAPVTWDESAPPEIQPPPLEADTPAMPVAVPAPAPAANAPAPAAAVPTPGASPAPAARSRRRRALVAGAALSALALAVASAAALLRPQDDRAAQMWGDDLRGPGHDYQLITSAPGFELNPALSPDGRRVIYAATRPGRRGTGLLLQSTEPTGARVLTDPPEGVFDGHPEWSPDGRHIAFQRCGVDGCAVMLVAAAGGPARTLLECDRRDLISYSWTPDSRGLLFGSMHSSDRRLGMRVLDLASGRWRAIDYDASARDLDYRPRYSPDGRWIVFVRNPQLGDLWRVPALGGRAEPLTEQRAEIRGWDWLPGGEALVFGRRIDGETRLYRLDLRTREVRDLGLAHAQSPSIAGTAFAFVHRRPRFGLFRLELMPPPGHEETKERLFASSGLDAQPAVAPDARQLVFNSDRSGRYSLWWADLSDPASLRRIDGLHPETRRLPEWSWDSRTVLVVGIDRSGRSGLFEVTPATGEVAPLPVPVKHPLQALYLPDPQRLLVGAGNELGQVRLTLFDRSQVPWRALGALDDVSLAKVDPPRRRVLFTRLSDDGLWQVDLDLSPGSIRRLDAAAPTRWGYRNWDVAADGRIYYLDQTTACNAYLREIATAQPASARCLQVDRLFGTNGFSIGKRGNALYVPLATDDGSDIAFMTLPAEPDRGVAGWIK